MKIGDDIRLIWNCWSRLCGVMVIFVIPAWLLAVKLFVNHNPVSVHSDQKLMTPFVKQGDEITYTVTVNRKRSCNGVIVDVFEASSFTEGRKIQVVNERPIISNKIESERRLSTSAPLPDSIPLGPARFMSTLVSECPEGRIIDPIIDVTFTVVPAL